MTEIDRSYNWHQAALQGTRGPIDADNPKAGYYRVRASRDGAFVPVAFWYDSHDGSLRCHRNGKSLLDIEARELWPYASKQPIAESVYWQKLDTGHWPDVDQAAAAVARGPDIDPATDPIGSMRAEIDKARAGVIAYASIDSDEQAARAQTLRSALTALAVKADKARKKEKDPHFEAAKAVDAKWQPLVKDAQDAAASIRQSQEAWETLKLQNQRRADEENRKREEEARKNQEWNDATPAGVVTERESVEFDRVVPNTPPPAMQIKGASGRTANVTPKKVVKSIDIDGAFKQFGGLPEVYNLFMDLAQRAVDAGREVPCATIEEKASVR